MSNTLFRPWLAFLFSGAVLALLVTWLIWPSSPKTGSPPSGQPLVLYCAAGIKAPVEATVSAFQKLTGIPVQVQYGGSQTLLASLEVSRRGDLYLPADDSFVEIARQKNLLAEVIPLARMKLALAVPRGNPKNIRNLDDLLRPDIRLGQGDPDATAIGHVTRATLQSMEKWKEIQRRTSVFKLTVNDVANDLKIGAIDAGFAWDAVVRQYSDLEMITVPAFSNAQATISIAVLRHSLQPTEALKFARFLSAPQHGAQEFSRQHFEVLPGDDWTERPELVLFSGAVNRVAVEESLRQFQEREGVSITCVYNGCGILVGQMKGGARPDAYLTCDASFVPPVADLFIPQPVPMSKTDIVMLVPKGNPRKIRNLADLGQAGLRVGVANPEQSTLGALTRRLLEQGGIHEQVMRNVATQTPTADLLVNQLRAGALDAVVVYTANTMKVRDQFEIVPLSIPGAIAIQTYSVGANSKHKRLVERLRIKLTSAESQARYQAAGFQKPE